MRPRQSVPLVGTGIYEWSNFEGLVQPACLWWEYELSAVYECHGGQQCDAEERYRMAKGVSLSKRSEEGETTKVQKDGRSEAHG